MIKINRIAKKNKDMQTLLEKLQMHAIELSVDASELVSLIKRQDPDYVKQIEDMENQNDSD